MNKYYAIFRVPTASMDEWMQSTNPETRKEQSDKMMQDWQTWAQENKAAIIDQGSPLGKTKTVTKDGITDSRNDLNYIMVVEADSHEDAAKLFSNNPHILTIPTSSIDVMEVPHTGM